MTEQVDSRKTKLGPSEALELARSVDHLWVAKGKNVLYFNMKKDKPSDEELARQIIGPTGNLRAPTLRRGKKLFVGYHAEEMAKSLLA